MKERVGNEHIEFSAGADGSFPEKEVQRREIVMGGDTTNTCNIALADIDGNGKPVSIFLIDDLPMCARCKGYRFTRRRCGYGWA